MLCLLKHLSSQPAEQEDTGAIAPGDSVECSWSYVLSGFVDKSWAQQAQPAHGSVWRPKTEFEVALAYRSWIPMVCSDRGVTLVLILRGFFWGSKELRWVLHISRPSTRNSPPSLRCWVRLYCWRLRAIGLLFPAVFKPGLTPGPMSRVYTCGFRYRGSSVPDSTMISQNQES